MAQIGTSTPLGPAWPIRPGKPVETNDRRQPDRTDRDGKKKKPQQGNEDDDNNPHIDEYA